MKNSVLTYKFQDIKKANLTDSPFLSKEIRLHIPPILTTHLIQGISDLPQ